MSNALLELPEEILEPEVEAICQRYRIDPEEARRILKDAFASRPASLRKILERYSEEDVTRFGSYREVIKHARKRVYYHLRQYHRDKEEEKRLKKRLDQLLCTSADPDQVGQVIADLLLTHVSTRERFHQYQAFYRTLFSLIEPPRAVLDVGCGIHPLSYPFDKKEPRPEIYVAMDKDPDVIEILTIFAPYAMPTHLMPICADFAEVEWTDYLTNRIDVFDIVFMLKLIPVIHRQSRDCLLKLAEVPARQALITASTEAMTRKESISRREDRALREFVRMTGRPIVGTFKVETEFGYLLGASV